MSREIFRLVLLLFILVCVGVSARAETGTQLLGHLANRLLAVPPAYCILQREFKTCGSYDSCDTSIPGIFIINACRYPIYINKIEIGVSGTAVLERVSRADFHVTDDRGIHSPGIWHLYGSSEAECKDVSEKAQALNAEKRTGWSKYTKEYQKFVGDCEKFILEIGKGFSFSIPPDTMYRFSGASEVKDAAGKPEFTVVVQGKTPPAKKEK